MSPDAADGWNSGREGIVADTDALRVRLGSLEVFQHPPAEACEAEHQHEDDDIRDHCSFSYVW
jgi:hypothetical protein